MLLVENVVDTGLTLNYVVKTLTLRDPADIAICTLFDRPYRRLVDDLPMRYVGFTIPDQFFLGYGFDLHERYRGLPGPARRRGLRTRIEITIQQRNEIDECDARTKNE